MTISTTYKALKKIQNSFLHFLIVLLNSDLGMSIQSDNKESIIPWDQMAEWVILSDQKTRSIKDLGCYGEVTRASQLNAVVCLWLVLKSIYLYFLSF